jgi:transposase
MSLEQEVEWLRGENAELRQLVANSQAGLRTAWARVAALEARIAELEAQIEQDKGAPHFVKPNRAKQDTPAAPRKQRASEHNTSRRRMTPTRIERHAMERCPDCDYPLRGESLDYSRQVIELPEPQPVEVIEHQVIKRWCPHCEAWRSPQLDLSGQVLSQGRMGVRVAALVAYLRTSLRLPVRAIQEYLETLHGLHVSVGEIVGLLARVAEAVEPDVAALREEVRHSPVVNGDETGWRQAGHNGYVWVFSTPAGVRYYEYDRSRSHWVPQRILGPDFQGYLGTDFYAGYNDLTCPHQRCWAHLWRDLHELKEKHPQQPEVMGWAEAVQELYDEAQAWLASHPVPTPEQRQLTYISLVERLVALGQRHARDSAHPCHTLAKRLLRHQEELFPFVLIEGLSADNNLAERSLRPLVIARKISGGTRSPQGSRTRMALSSLFATWRARFLNPFTECLKRLSQPATAAA